MSNTNKQNLNSQSCCHCEEDCKKPTYITCERCEEICREGGLYCDECDHIEYHFYNGEENYICEHCCCDECEWKEEEEKEEEEEEN